MCTFVYFFRYDDGFNEEWYRVQRLPRERSITGVESIRSWHTLHAERDSAPLRPLNNYDRLTEIRFSGLDAITSALCSLDSFWQAEHRRGLSRFHAIAVPNEPEYDLRRDVPAQHYPYLAMPIRWRTGKEPEAPEPQGTAMAKYMYFFGYPKQANLRASEDWYLGHHTREGKQLPGLLRYLTYRHLPIPDLAAYLPEAATFYRFTELCFDSIETQQRVCDLEGPIWTPSPRYGPVTWDWDTYRCFFIAGEPDIVLERETVEARQGSAVHLEQFIQRGEANL